ncbi:hypothetical protein Tco_0536266 [Tanacetum coccineum]
MACALPHTDSEVEALVQRLINEDKGRQDVILNLAFQFEDSCAVRDDLRKAYEKCNDISQESRALICTLLKESSEKDRKLHLSIGIGYSSSQSNCPLTEKELHQLRMDEEAQKGMLEEDAMNKKAQEEKIRQEQAENDAFFLEFGVVSEHTCFALSSNFDSVISLAHYDACHLIPKIINYMVSPILGLGGLEFFEFVHDPQHVCPRYQLPSSAILRSHSRQLRENPAIRRSDARVVLGVANEGVVNLYFQGSKLVPVQVIGLPERLASQVFLDWNVPWRLPVPGSCQINLWVPSIFETRCIAWLCILGLDDMSRSVGFWHWEGTGFGIVTSMK